MKPKYSILLTVFNREPEVLGRTLAALYENDLSDCEVIVVDDGSTVDYGPTRSDFPEAKWLRLEATDYPKDTFMLPHDQGGVYNNPAKALNTAIEAAQGDRLVFVGSDCIVPKDGIARAKQAGFLPWFGSVKDRGRMILGDVRPVPYHWFLSVEKWIVDAVGRFDEGFLRGFACEDDDFGAKLGLYCGAVQFALDVVVEHQAHPRYLDEHKDECKVGYDRSLEYLVEKWGGNPWPVGSRFVQCERKGETLIAYRILEDGIPDPLNGERHSQAATPPEPKAPKITGTNGASKRHLFVGIPSVDSRVTVQLRRYLSGLENAAAQGLLPFTVSVAEVTGIAPVQYARNVLCGMALQSPATEALMIDADMTPEPSLSRLLFSEADVIVPRMYRFRHHGRDGIHDGPPELACCATIIQEDGKRLDLIPKPDATGVVRIDACGTGAIRIKREVLEDERMRVGPDEDGVPAIFQMKYSPTGRITEWEDVDFSRRASELGYTVAVDLGARCGHLKTLNLDSVEQLLHTAPEFGEVRQTPEPTLMDQRSAEA